MDITCGFWGSVGSKLRSGSASPSPIQSRRLLVARIAIQIDPQLSGVEPQLRILLLRTKNIRFRCPWERVPMRSLEFLCNVQLNKLPVIPSASVVTLLNLVDAGRESQ